MPKKLTVTEENLRQVRKKIEQIWKEYHKLQAYHAKITGRRHVWFGGGE